jgi:hypothetical protein
VVELDFNDGSGPIASDSSGNGNTGYLEGATWTPQGRTGSALSFNGVNSYLRIPDSSSMDFDKSQGTIEMWIKPNNPSNGVWQPLMLDDQGEYWDIELNIQADGDLYFYPWVGDQVWNNYNLVTNPLQPGEWNHVAVTWQYSTKEVSIYVNGTEQVYAIENVPTYWTSLAQTGNWYIGGSPDTEKDQYFDGLIDEVKVYSRDLSAAEILQHYNAGSCLHQADEDCDGCILIDELLAYIDDWKSPGTIIIMPELMVSIGLWKGGLGVTDQK